MYILQFIFYIINGFDLFLCLIPNVIATSII